MWQIIEQSTYSGLPEDGFLARMKVEKDEVTSVTLLLAGREKRKRWQSGSK